MASIHKRGKKWLVYWRDADGGQRTRTCPTAEAAKRLKLEVETARALGRAWEVPAARREPHIEALMTAFLTEYTRLRKPGSAAMRAMHLEVFAAFLAERYGTADPPATVLSRDLLSAYYASLSDRALSTRKKYVQAVEQAWRWCAESDDFRGQIPAPATLPMAAPPRRRTLAPTWEEMDSCVRACLDTWPPRKGIAPKRANVPLYRLAIVLRYTGLRVQQAMQLVWDDVDLGRALLTIRPELGKTDAEQVGRVVPLSPHFVSELRGWGRREGWLVPSTRTGPNERIARQQDMVRAWARSGAREAVYVGQSHHAMRKGFVSGLRRLGADVDAVEYLVGHDTGLRGVYTDPDALPLVEAVALIPRVAMGVVSLDAARQGAV